MVQLTMGDMKNTGDVTVRVEAVLCETDGSDQWYILIVQTTLWVPGNAMTGRVL